MITKKWQADVVSSNIGFGIKHLGFSKVRGRFDKFDVTADIKDGQFTQAKLKFSADTASINTFDQARNDHLCKADFFDASQYPKLHFQSTCIIAQLEAYVIEGELTMKGRTKPIVLKAQVGKVFDDPWGGKRFGMTMQTQVNRKEFGLNFNNKLVNGKMILGECVDIYIDLEFI